MSIKELRDRQAQIVTEARERLDQIDKADEARAKELEAQHDAAMAEYDILEKKIEREEQLAQLEHRAKEQRKKMRPSREIVEGHGQDEEDKPNYRSVFYKMLSVGGDMGDLSQEERSILRDGIVAKKDAEFRVTVMDRIICDGLTYDIRDIREIGRREGLEIDAVARADA